MSFAYKKLNQSDVVTEQYTSNKGYTASLNNLLEEGYHVLFGQRPVSGALFDPLNSPKNPDGSYRELVYESIKHLYYYNYISGSQTGSFFRSSSYFNFDQNTLVSGNLNTVIKDFPGIGGFRGLYDSMSNYDTDAIYDGRDAASLTVLDFDKSKFGSGISPGTFKISSSAYFIQDDGLGNIYAISESLFQADYSNPESDYAEALYGPDSSSLGPFIANNPHKTYIGNIMYSHGVAVITHPEYLCILGSAPVAVNNVINKSNVDCDKKLDLLGNDFDDCYQIDPETIDFHSISGSTWPFNYTVDENGFLDITPDEISTTPGIYELGYTVRNELGRTSNSASIKLALNESPLTGSFISIDDVCFPDPGFPATHATGAVTFSINYGVPFYSWSNDNTSYFPVPDLCQPIVSGTITASFDGFIYLKDRNNTIFSMSYSNVYPTMSSEITTQSVGFCVHNPFVPPTPTPTRTVSVTPTRTISLSSTPSVTPSISPSQNNSPSATPSATPTRTVTSTPSRTRTPSITRTPSTSFLCGTHTEDLSYGGTANIACNNSSTSEYYGNGIDWTAWSAASFKTVIGCSVPSAGWYSDGNVARYWSGTAWTFEQFCQSQGGGGPSD